MENKHSQFVNQQYTWVLPQLSWPVLDTELAFRMLLVRKVGSHCVGRQTQEKEKEKRQTQDKMLVPPFFSVKYLGEIITQKSLRDSFLVCTSCIQATQACLFSQERILGKDSEANILFFRSCQRGEGEQRKNLIK